MVTNVSTYKLLISMLIFFATGRLKSCITPLIHVVPYMYVSFVICMIFCSVTSVVLHLCFQTFVTLFVKMKGRNERNACSCIPLWYIGKSKTQKTLASCV